MKAIRKYSELLFHILGWVIFILFPFYTFQMDHPGFSFTNKIISSLILPIYFYLNMYLFVPQFLNKKKYTFFILSMVLGYFAIYLSNKFSGRPEPVFRPMLMPNMRHEPGPPETFRAIFPFLFIFTTSTFIKLFQLWQKDQHQRD